MSFVKLAKAILDAFDFDFDHLYKFTFEDSMKNPVRVVDPNSSGDLDAEEVEIGMVSLQEGSEIKFHYDFGDNWQFEVVLESIAPKDPDFKGAKLLETHGESFPQYPDGNDMGW